MAQIKQPYFRNAQDSIQYQALMQYYKTIDHTTPKKALDSLANLHEKLPAGYRTIYLPTKGVPQWEGVSHSNRPDTITAIVFYGKHHKKLKHQLARFSNLKYLELVNTSIKKIPRSLQQNLHLHALTIMDNHHKGKLKFGRNTTLEKLTIKGGKSTRQPRNMGKLKAVQKMVFENTEFAFIPKRLLKCTALEELRFVKCKFENPPIFKTKAHQRLTTLVFQNCNLHQFPANLQSFINLKTLTLAENHISFIPETISALQSLENLSLYKNQIRELPPSMFTLPNLKEIDVYYNKLTHIPGAIQNLQNLEVLYLSHNNLYALPEKIGSLSKLSQLFIHHNKLSYLPQSLGQHHQSLKVLHLNNNLFQEFPRMICNLQNIEDLDFSQNNLSSFPIQACHFPHLKYLSLAGNPYSREFMTSMEFYEFIKNLERRNVIMPDVMTGGNE